MAKPGPIIHTGGSSALTLITTAETVVATVGGVSLDNPGAAVILEGNVDVTTGVGTTGVIVRVRRDGLTGGTVGFQEQPTAAAGNDVSVPFQTVNSPGEIAGGVYVLTVQQVGATGNGTCNSASLQATY